MKRDLQKLWAECVIKHTKTPMNWQNVADEYADLIVKECISIALEYDAPKLSGPGLIIAMRIESNFGIKE